MHLKQPSLLAKSGFTYSAYGPFTTKKKKRKKERTQNFKDSQYIYQNELDKACCQHDMAANVI